MGRGACFADYDNDGKVDAFLVNLGGAGVLLHNVTAWPGHWLMVRLVGTKSNRDGIGATVEVARHGVTQSARARGGIGLPRARTTGGCTSGWAPRRSATRSS